MVIIMFTMENPAVIDPENPYLRTKMYKIICHSTDDIYVGSTYERKLQDRFKGHLRKYRGWSIGLYSYTSSFDLFKRGYCAIELIEDYPCQTADERFTREQHWIEHYKDNCVNKNAAKDMRTPEERKEYQLAYILEHKEERNEYQRAYNREHRKEQKDYQKDYQRVYRREHKEERKAKTRQRVVCECNVEMSRNSLKSHKKTKLHVDKMLRLQEYDRQAGLLQIIPLKFIESYPIIPASPMGNTRQC
jgi:predicted acetyltransferase